ncbi:MAG: glycoside hydrolase family 16 protein [Nocardioides sp.]|uniref:glycoside hydrolase family 16 protein n=1 Tax=Nocardioides sp. TaxID=35761 RepID=UPI003F0DD8EA
MSPVRPHRPAQPRRCLVAGTAALLSAGALVLAGCSGVTEVGPVEEGGLPTTSTPTPTVEPVELEVDPAVRTRVLPRLAAHGSTPQAADRAAWVVEVTDPALRKNRTVELEVRGNGRWSVVDTATSRKGAATLTTTRAGRLRVVVDREAGRVGRAVDTSSAPAVSLTDEFDTWDRALWQTRAQGYAGARMCSRSDDAAVEARGGVIRLSVLDDPGAGMCTVDGRAHAYRLNAHIGTEGRYAFTHGFAAARVKFQPRQGQHGAFWLQTPWIGFGPASTTGAEIDVMEYFGDSAAHGGLASFVYWYAQQGQPATKIGDWVKNHQQLGSNWSSEYHVFSVEWTPEEYVFRVDDTIAWRTSEGVSNVPEFLVLSLLSSDYELKEINDARLPQTMQVDWVRTWVTGSQQGTYLG